MPEYNSETNIVEALRSKVEESDIRQYLKSTLGGYTKQSVLEYLNLLRKQQQSMADTFFHNQQLLYEEKENLRKSSDALKGRLVQVESEYKELSDSLKIQKLDNEEFTPSDVLALKRNITELEDEITKSGIEKSHLEKQIEHLQGVIDDLSLKLEQSKQEKLSIREILKAETEKSQKQNAQIMSLLGTIEERDEEIRYLNSLVSEGRLADLTEKVSELTEQLISQAEVMGNYNKEFSLKLQTIETLTQENQALKQRNGDLLKDLEEQKQQSDKYLAVNKDLTEQLEYEYKKEISLIKERSAVTVDKLTLSRKLDEANSKTILLELQLKKQLNNDTACESVYDEAINTVSAEN